MKNNGFTYFEELMITFVVFLILVSLIVYSSCTYKNGKVDEVQGDINVFSEKTLIDGTKIQIVNIDEEISHYQIAIISKDQNITAVVLRR